MTKLRPLFSSLFLIVMLIAPAAFSQSSNIVDKLRSAFQDFSYEKVIFSADSIIVNSAVLEKSDLLEIYRLKAISQFSIGQQNFSELTFKTMLQIDSNYVLEPSINSPKIILLFNTIKEQHRLLSKESNPLLVPDTERVERSQKDYIAAAGRSVIFPGWGHNYLNEEPGNWFMAGSAVLIPLSVYFTAASWHYEKEYLNEIDALKIEKRFNKFDDAYKIRNILFASYLIYWLYIQYDFFGRNPYSADESNIVLHLSQNKPQQIQMTLEISF